MIIMEKIPITKVVILMNNKNNQEIITMIIETKDIKIEETTNKTTKMIDNKKNYHIEEAEVVLQEFPPEVEEVAIQNKINTMRNSIIKGIRATIETEVFKTETKVMTTERELIIKMLRE